MIKLTDIAEIKRIINKDNYSGVLRRVSGACVDGEKDIVHTFSKSIASLPGDEIYKYLKIAGEIPNTKSFEDKTMELEFREDSVVPKLLNAIAATDLKDEQYLNDLYERIVNDYSIENGFLILVFHGVYDVIKKAMDGAELDESEEVYDFLICAICPVNWDKPGLKYDDLAGKICAKQLQEIVGKVETGFIWPAFEERSGNRDKCLFYAQKPKDPQHIFIQKCLDCKDRMTASEHRELFEKLVRRAVLNCQSVGEVYTDTVLQKLNMEFEDIVNTEHTAADSSQSILTDIVLAKLCTAVGLHEVLRDKLLAEYRKDPRWFNQGWPKVRWLYDHKAAAVAQHNKKIAHMHALMHQAAKVCEASGQQDLAQEIKKMLEVEDE